MTTKALTDEQYESVINALANGFYYIGADGKQHKFRRSERLLVMIQVEAISGIRISDILKLRLCDLPLNGINHRSFNIIEQKTGKKRNYEIPEPLYNLLVQYAFKHKIAEDEILFDITDRNIQQQLKIVGNYLGIENLGTHSFRKRAATEIYINSGYDLLSTASFLQHSSPQTTLRYLGADNKRVMELLNSRAKDIRPL